MSTSSPHIHLILGGARSGKSSHAERLAHRTSCEATYYLATYIADSSDPEMTLRLQRHRERRPSEWNTIEGRHDLTTLFSEIPPASCVLLDCLTLWLSGRMAAGLDESQTLDELSSALNNALTHRHHLLIVSNETGSGLVPADPLSRAFRDLAGRANQLTASQAHEVELIVAGLPLRLKG